MCKIFNHILIFLPNPNHQNSCTNEKDCLYLGLWLPKRYWILIKKIPWKATTCSTYFSGRLAAGRLPADTFNPNRTFGGLPMCTPTPGTKWPIVLVCEIWPQIAWMSWECINSVIVAGIIGVYITYFSVIYNSSNFPMTPIITSGALLFRIPKE